MSDSKVREQLERVDIRNTPILLAVPTEVAGEFAPKKLPDKPVVRYHMSKK